MTTKRRHSRQPPDATAASSIRWPALLRSVVLGGAATLVAVTLLVPSESAIAEGTYAPAAAGWCLLLAIWAVSLVLDERPAIELGCSEAAGAALVGWHSLAAVVSLGHVNGRQALNAHWLVIGYGIAALVVRQTLRTAQEVRALVAAMLALAALVASLGIYQYAYGMPRLRGEYERNPEAVLHANGIPAEANSPQRELFENRLRSVEPLATFALTNSLAGFLAPWLIAALAVGLATVEQMRVGARTAKAQAFAEQKPPIKRPGFFEPGPRRTLVGLVAIAAITASCLILTKSRTAYLAVLGGLVLVGLYGRRSGWQFGWRLPAGLAAAAIVLGLAAVFAGGLDAQVLSEAPKSVLYRAQYWQATARVIAEHPLFGSGPGNFQTAYAAYKLPQASETVADPHNLFLELWATAGTPAVALLLALLAAFVLDVALTARHGETSQPSEREPPIAPPARILFGGAIAGLAIGPFIASVAGYPLEPVVPALRFVPVLWLLAAAIVPLTWWALGPWIERGELTLAALIIPQIVLLVNLLAAGALVYPGVIITLCVLAPAALVAAHGAVRPPTEDTPPGASPTSLPMPRSIEHSTGAAPEVRTVGFRAAKAGAFAERKPIRLSRPAAALMALATVALAAACFYTEYYPVLNGRLALADALYRLEQRLVRDVEPRAIAAARADSLSPEPWRLLAEVRLARWEASGSAADWEAFVQAADTFRQLDPRSHLAWYTRGNWFLEAWKKSGRKEDLDQAVSAYTQASIGYPNRALYHAQLAWALYLAGEGSAASQAAERAAELDRQMPHREQRLARQHIFDPQLEGGEPQKFRPESAEQTTERLRNLAAEKQP